MHFDNSVVRDLLRCLCSSNAMRFYSRVTRRLLAVCFIASFTVTVWTINNHQRPTYRTSSFFGSDGIGQSSGVESDENIPENSYSEIPFHPFVAGQPKAVVILTYIRSGSSFLGQMFNTNPNAFYMFEPLDSLYAAMYGLKNAWNNPSDVTNFWNGSERILPKVELDAVSSFLHNIFACSVDAWPTGVFVHESWTYRIPELPSTSNYSNCLRMRHWTSVKCYRHTIGFCGERLGRWPSRTDECRRLLTDTLYRANYTQRNISMQFETFDNCWRIVRRVLNASCLNMLKSNCHDRQLRAVKTVRATMESMEQLLRTLPNARVIHLIRDPRAVALSRTKFGDGGDGHFSGDYGNGSVILEGKYHCRTVTRDIRVKEQLNVKFPGRIYTVIYEDVVRDLLKATQKIYRFIDEPIHNKTFEWIRSNTHNRSRYGTYIASKWKYALTVHQSEETVRHCSGVYNFSS